MSRRRPNLAVVGARRGNSHWHVTVRDAGFDQSGTLCGTTVSGPLADVAPQGEPICHGCLSRLAQFNRKASELRTFVEAAALAMGKKPEASA